MKKESSLPSRKEYHKNKAKKNRGKPQKKEREDDATPSLMLVRILALVFLSIVTVFLLYSIYS